MKQRRLFASLLLLLLLFIGTAVAQTTPANTEIVNQASATFLDSAGQPRSTTSNQVVTIVQPVYSFTITPDSTTVPAEETFTTTVGQSRTAPVGGNVYFNYLVTNTGNASDMITLSVLSDTTDTGLTGNGTLGSQNIYIDGNCNGNPDPGELDQDTVTLDTNESECVILAGTVSAAGSGHVDLKGVGNEGSTDTGNWATFTGVATAALDARLSASPASVIPSDRIITYTYTGSNNGDAAFGVPVNMDTLGTITNNITDNEGIILVSDVPDDTTYNLASLEGTAGAGAGVIEVYRTSTGWQTDEPTDAEAVLGVGIIIDAGDPAATDAETEGFFPQTASYQMSFAVTADAIAAGGEIVNLGSTLTFGTAPGDLTGTVTTSNRVRHTTSANYGVAVGPSSDPTAETGDTQTITSYTGETVVFGHTLQNAGNTTDSFTLALALTNEASTQGWSCSLRYSDGTTPMANRVGPLSGAETFDFAVSCTIPPANSNEYVTDNDSPATITITATSVGDTSATDTTVDQVTEVTAGFGVDIKTSAAATPTEYNLEGVETQTLLPGQQFTVPLKVFNLSPQSEVFNLTSSVAGSASGWSTLIYPDGDCDGVMDTGVSPTTKTARLAAPGEACFVAQGIVPAGTGPADYDVSFTTTSTADTSTVPASDSADGTFTVDTVTDIVLEPDRAGTVTNPGTITYSLSLRNRGNDTATVDIPNPGSTFGWVYQLSTDNGTWQTAISGFSVGPSANQPIYVRILVPAGQPIGHVDTRSLTATATFGTSGPTGADSATLTTTVVGGDLVLEKKARVCETDDCSGDTDEPMTTETEAKPDEYIEYKVTATNIGTAHIKHVIVMEPLPNFTSFESISAEGSDHLGTKGTDYQILFTDNPDGPTPTWIASDDSWNAGSFETGDAIYIGLDTTPVSGAFTDVTDSDELPPSASITITFVVRVK